MNRTLISVVLLFAVVVITLKLVLDSGHQLSGGASQTSPAVRQPQPAVIAGPQNDEPSPPIALRPDVNKSSLNLRVLPCEGEDDCCGLDGLPSAQIMAERNVRWPKDHLGRISVAVDLDQLPIPIPELDEATVEQFIQLANFQEDASADDNETPGPAIETPANPMQKDAPIPGSEAVVPIDTPRTVKAIPKNPTPAAPQPKLTPEMQQLRDKIRTCLAHYYFNRQETVAGRSPWGVMHCLIAFGVDTQVIANNRRVNSIGWLCYNGTCKGQNIFF
jgi:hypothetical protein